MRTCEFCNVAFVNIFLKQQHVSKVHLSKESLPFTCNICEIDLETETGYQAHMKKHISGESPYHCQKCKYRTSVRKYFYEHFVDKHSNEALVCPICLHQEDLRPSTRRSKHIFVRSFVEHMQLHATCQQFRCHTCSLSFNKRNELEAHRSGHHTLLNNLWQVHERPKLNEHEKARMSRRMKISSLQRRFLETLEGHRITDETACSSGAERLGFDTTASGDTLYECACGFNSYNGNRTASHFHKCRKAIQFQDIERDREVVRHEGDPEDELEIFAIYPQPTETEKETEVSCIHIFSSTKVLKKLQVVARQKLQLEKEELTKLRMMSYESEPIDDLLLLKMLSSSDDKSSEIIDECFKAIMLNEDD
uniref:C2H2-type domain-containing protein n=1 Tax=Caenorhabditis tropicalis TaxID=1561998 RepID=A0A1I7T8P2_9PELO